MTPQKQNDEREKVGGRGDDTRKTGTQVERKERRAQKERRGEKQKSL